MLLSIVLRVVLETNVVVAGLRSRSGASAVILDLVEQRALSIAVNAPLLDEYEAVLQRPEHQRAHGLSDGDLHRFLRGLVEVAELVATRLDRRLVLVRDPDDAKVAEAAIDGGVDHLVTHNRRHFGEVADVLSAVTRGELLRIVAELER
jgi:putative PIN family toxin of toxin-antitoxin system